MKGTGDMPNHSVSTRRVFYRFLDMILMTEAVSQQGITTDYYQKKVQLYDRCTVWPLASLLQLSLCVQHSYDQPYCLATSWNIMKVSDVTLAKDIQLLVFSFKEKPEPSLTRNRWSYWRAGKEAAKSVVRMARERFPKPPHSDISEAHLSL